MQWISSSLNRKFIAGTAAGLLVSSFVFLILFITMYQNELERERGEAVTHVNNLLKSSLENAMLKRDLDGLRTIVDRLGMQKNITNVMISNPAGQIRFSSHPGRIGNQLSLDLVKSMTPVTRYMQDESGVEVLRSINPVLNKAQCIECHGPASISPVNGVLLVDYDASSIRDSAQKTTLLLMGSGALIVLINLTGGWWFIRRYILRPVDKLSTASNAISQGELDIRVNIDGSDELALFGATFNRMAENLQTSILELEESKTFLQSMIDAIPDGVRILDSDYNIVLVNRTYRDQCMVPENSVINEKCYATIHDRDSPCPTTLVTCPIDEIKRNPVALKVVHQHFRSDGSSMDVEIFAAPMEVTHKGKPETLIVESIRNLSHQVKFSHEHRLSELGQLSAGVAHEIYNPLTAVHLTLHAFFKDLEKSDTNPDEMREYLHIVDAEIDKCINVTERLLKLSAAPASQIELVSIQTVVEETLSLLKGEADKLGIELSMNLGDKELRVHATDSEMRMLVLNLTQNAFHAMPDGGRLQVAAIENEDFVELSFDDTGVGISKENIDRIFYPFFSRRADMIHGTGLGLSISKNIVENYGGSLEVESTEGQGSRFTIRLPEAASSIKSSEQ